MGDFDRQIGQAETTVAIFSFWAPKAKVGPFAVKRRGMKLRRFQKEFLDKALAPGIDIAALSLSRGNGKSFLAAHILTRCLTPGDVLHQPGKEYVNVAGSLEQARLVFLFISPNPPKDVLGDSP